MELIEKLLTAVLSTITILTVSYKYGIKPLYKSIIMLRDKINDSAQHIKFIESELKPNHGGSIKDIIQNISKQQIINSKNLDEVKLSIRKVADLATIANSKSSVNLKKSSIPMFECDALTGSCTWSNEALQKLFGLSESQVLGNGWLAALHPDDTQNTYNIWQKTVKECMPYRHRYRIIVDNVVHLVESSAEVVTDTSGKALMVFGIVEVIK